MNHGLSSAVVDKIHSVLAQHPEISTAILYGSRAKGNFKTGSDIDLTLRGPCLTSSLLSTISMELDDLNLPYGIDLSILEQLDHEGLKEHIVRVGTVFYDRGPQVGASKESSEGE
ncbi:nucleotidyltransferase domain-containing protein [soil metagenome]